MPFDPESQTRGENQMPLFLDVHHHVPGAKAKDVDDAHMKDLKVQGKYGVKYIKYWLDESKGKIYCLVDESNNKAAEKVNSEAHGLVADERFEVKDG